MPEEIPLVIFQHALILIFVCGCLKFSRLYQQLVFQLFIKIFIHIFSTALLVLLHFSVSSLSHPDGVTLINNWTSRLIYLCYIWICSFSHRSNVFQSFQIRQRLSFPKVTRSLILPFKGTYRLSGYISRHSISILHK